MAVNTASRRVMEKAGLRYIRTFHQDWPEPIPGDEHGEVEYALTKAEWEADGSLASGFHRIDLVGDTPGLDTRKCLLSTV